MSATPLSAPDNAAQSPDISDVIFDFCEVLIDWQLHACLDGVGSQELVDRICADDDPYGFLQYEDRMDAGEDFADIIDEYRKEYGAEAAELFTYYQEHYADALPQLMPGMRELLIDLKNAKYRLWGLTNWSHETFHTAFETFPELPQLLDGTLVSGIEKKHKPNTDFFELALERFRLTAGQCVFFDDSHQNVAAAAALGIHAFDFVDAATARNQLRNLGVRIPEGTVIETDSINTD